MLSGVCESHIITRSCVPMTIQLNLCMHAGARVFMQACTYCILQHHAMPGNCN